MLRKLLIYIFSAFVSCYLFCSCSQVSESPAPPTETPTATDAPTSTPTPTPTPDTRLAVNRANFPDSGFRNYILDHFDSDYDEMLSEDELSKITSIDISEKGVETLDGVHLLPLLDTLICKNNRISSLNLEKNKLKYLDCSENLELKTIQFGGCILSIEYLNLTHTNVSQVLDVV